MLQARYLLDTNVLVNTFDPREQAKQARASQLVHDALVDQRGLISSQVTQEFLNVATRKFERPLSGTDARDYLERVMTPLREVFTSVELFHQALSVAERWQYPFYDPLIVAAAIEANADLLYSEDLRHGQEIGTLTILDPFR